MAEVDALARHWINYPGLKEACFAPRGGDAAYCDFAPAIAKRRDIADLVKAHPGVLATHQGFMDRLGTWWGKVEPMMTRLAEKNGLASGNEKADNVYALRRGLMEDISESFADQSLLNPFQIRGGMARYVDGLKIDLKSVAASGWGRS